MKKISVSKLKADCSAILDRLDPEGIEITKHGRTIARLLPVERQSVTLIGSMRGKIKKKGDILSVGVKWRAPS